VMLLVRARPASKIIPEIIDLNIYSPI